MNGSEQSVAAAEYSGLVHGPSAVFPRGGLWMLAIGYAVVCLVLVLLVRDPLAVNLLYVVGLGSSTAALVVIFSRAKSRAFAADDGGIWLGVSKEGVAARRVRVGWDQIRELRISAYPHGSVLQILLNSGACPPGTPRLIAGLARSMASLLLWYVPLGFRRARPGLLTVLPDPPRYRVPLAQVTPDELRTALAALAPASVAIVTTT